MYHAVLLATAVLSAHVQHEAIKGPIGWESLGEVPSGEVLRFTFALKHSEEGKVWLKRTVDEVSDPRHERYGKYVGIEEIRARMGVTEEQVSVVMDSLKEAGMFDAAVHYSGDFITAYATAEVAAAYFHTPFCSYKAPARGMTITRACLPSYHLPQAVSAAVDIVSGLLHFPTSTGLQVQKASSPNLPNFIDQCRTTYKTAGVKSTGNASVAFTQFLGQWYDPSDLQKFEERYIPDQKGQTIVKKVGPWQAGYGSEAQLDSQYLVGMGAGVDTWVWTNQNLNSVNNEEPWVEFFANVSSAQDVPMAFSISYGESETTLTSAYMQRSDTETQKVAARGITVVVASGDQGAGCGIFVDQYYAQFPASLPYVTSVGATRDCEAGTKVAAFSSGGFSGLFPMPSWQTKLVRAYLAKTSILPPKQYYNDTGRAFPDVSACGNVAICNHGICDLSVAGTSCSCPIFSGVLSLINSARIAAGKTNGLGFVAPALYQAYEQDSSIFDDITTGKTDGCNNKDGWEAAEGWDPASGLGTPNYPNLLKALVNL